MILTALRELPSLDPQVRFLTITDFNRIKRWQLKELMESGQFIMLGCEQKDLGIDQPGRVPLAVVLGIETYQKLRHGDDLESLPTVAALAIPEQPDPPPKRGKTLAAIFAAEEARKQAPVDWTKEDLPWA